MHSEGGEGKGRSNEAACCPPSTPRNTTHTHSRNVCARRAHLLILRNIVQTGQDEAGRNGTGRDGTVLDTVQWPRLRWRSRCLSHIGYK